MSLYQRYLVADRLVKRTGVSLEDVLSVDLFYLSEGVSVALWKPCDPEDVERLAVDLLDRYPDFKLGRQDGAVLLFAKLSGIQTRLFLGHGVCERIQVGEQWVEPVEGHMEPVYETICGDPLYEAVTS